MYNGIGLRTVRGSATSGHVQANRAHVRSSQVRRVLANHTGANVGGKGKGVSRVRANPEILEHQRKRAIEAKLFELQETMAEQGHGEAEIEKRVSAERRKLEGSHRSGGSGGADSHSVVMRKEKEMARLANAFGVPQDFREGESFSAEAQAERRKQREEEKAARKAARAEEAEKRRLEAEEAAAKRAEANAQRAAEEKARVERFRREEAEYRDDNRDIRTGRHDTSSSSRSRSRDRYRHRNRDRDRSRSRSRNRSRSRRPHLEHGVGAAR